MSTLADLRRLTKLLRHRVFPSLQLVLVRGLTPGMAAVLPHVAAAAAPGVQVLVDPATAFFRAPFMFTSHALARMRQQAGVGARALRLLRS